MWEMPERDWRYLRSVHDEMLEALSRRINDEVRVMLARADISENEKRGKVYDIVRKRDRIVAGCFDDWRGSRSLECCWSLRKHGLLRPVHIDKHPPGTQKA